MIKQNEKEEVIFYIGRNYYGVFYTGTIVAKKSNRKTVECLWSDLGKNGKNIG